MPLRVFTVSQHSYMLMCMYSYSEKGIGKSMKKLLLSERDEQGGAEN